MVRAILRFKGNDKQRAKHKVKHHQYQYEHQHDGHQVQHE